MHRTMTTTTTPPTLTTPARLEWDDTTQDAILWSERMMRSAAPATGDGARFLANMRAAVALLAFLLAPAAHATYINPAASHPAPVCATAKRTTVAPDGTITITTRRVCTVGGAR